MKDTPTGVNSYPKLNLWINHLFLVGLFCVFLTSNLYAQTLVNRKEIQALWTDLTPHIDGQLDESIWQQAQWLSGFVQLEPYNGRPATEDTRIAIAYDDRAIYIAAYMEVKQPDLISLEMSSRDQIGMADYFEVQFDPFDDGLNAFVFCVTAKGVQIDYKINSWDVEDYSWDAVWRSAVAIHNEGWTAELMIPYSAIRFPEAEVQQWGINFVRSIQSKREYSSWNFVDSNRKGKLKQAGQLILQKKIKPPIRISATPYLSASASHHSLSNSWSNAYNAGLDLKLGLSKSFTLDMTLIPDFGQVVSDDRVFSLSPYEVFYEERRPFFTEGTELFSKGNLFYTRRIGGKPAGYDQIQQSYTEEEIIANPESIQLINAVKLTGKTQKGLAVGLFNAITDHSQATLKTKEGNLRHILTAPATNYNMLVVEQSLPNNSLISLYNTNVWKNQSGGMANVSGVETLIRDPAQQMEYHGTFHLSQHYQSDADALYGTETILNVEKISSKIRPSTWLNILSDTYNPNAMGYQQKNNEISHGVRLKMLEFEPKNKILKWNTSITVSQIYLYNPKKFVSLIVDVDGVLTTADHLSLGAGLNWHPIGTRDYFEPRVKGRFVQQPWKISGFFWGSPDYRKKLMADYQLNLGYTAQYKQFSWMASVSPRWKVRDNFLITSQFAFDYTTNDHGYVRDTLNPASKAGRVILFGRREVKNITNSLTADYAFKPDISLSFRLRHYWLIVGYHDFYDLLEDGGLYPSTYQNDEDFSVNAFNIDMVLKWNFVPGSELLLIWKNAIYEQQNGNGIPPNYFSTIGSLIDMPIANSFNVKLLYYIDWQQIQNLTRSNKRG